MMPAPLGSCDGSFGSPAHAAERLFWWALAGSLALKLVLAALLPLTQDEAYFSMWGAHPALGYSEHPPMIGWWLYPILELGASRFLVRLPAVLATLSIGWGIFLLLRDRDPERAAWAAILYLVSPLNLCFVIITTDTPLVFFSFWSAAAFVRALQGGRMTDWARAGFLLGCAFLSKYFAVLLGLAFAACLLATPLTRRRVLGMLVLLAAVLPAGILDIFWNYHHSWLQINSNLFYRNDGDGPNLATPLLFAATALYLLLPVGALEWWRAGRRFGSRLRAESAVPFAILYLVPMACFAALSVVKKIGLHWLLSFAAFSVLVTWAVSGSDGLRRATRLAAWLSAAHLVLVLAAVAVPLRCFAGSANYPAIVMAARHRELAAAIAPFTAGRKLGADGYGSASLLSFYNPGFFSHFGRGTAHGRQDDILTDWREWEGRDALVVFRRPPPAAAYEGLFDSVRLATVEVEGHTFHLVLGDRFRLDAFRERVLVPVRDRYYDVPDWLPMRQCFFRARYFPEEAVRGGRWTTP
jgi:hypothetical protein